MDTKTQLITYVKQWVSIDEELKQLQSVIRDKRKKQKALNEVLIHVMKKNEIDCFDTKNGKILYSVNKTKKAITKKMLLETLQKYYKNDDDKAAEMVNYILESRVDNITEHIKRKDANKD